MSLAFRRLPPLLSCASVVVLVASVILILGDFGNVTPSLSVIIRNNSVSTNFEVLPFMDFRPSMRT